MIPDFMRHSKLRLLKVKLPAIIVSGILWNCQSKPHKECIVSGRFKNAPTNSVLIDNDLSDWHIIGLN